MTRLRILTPSRLHFGLLGWGARARRQFGGVGLMVEKPGLEILAERSESWSARGPLADRTLRVATEVADRLAEDGAPVGPVSWTIVRLPEPHVGLGVGTQLSLAVARALTELSGHEQTSVETLARLTGRGQRSGIGVHGFHEGGLIVDAGRTGDRDVPTRLLRLEFPAEWSVLIVIPERRAGLHGAEEVQAFRTLPPMPESVSERLCHLILLGLLPAVIETDLAHFGNSLTEIQQIVGETFAPVQGGLFGHRDMDRVVHTLTSLGLHGVGQSSWGPALYGFSDAGEEERAGQRELLIKRFALNPEMVFWTRASTTGATISRF